MDGRPGSSRLARRVFTALAIGVLVGACGGDSLSSSTTTATPPTTTPPTTTTPSTTTPSTTTASADDVCDDAQALRSSVDELTDVDLVAEGTDAASAAISAVKDDLAALGESAGDELQPQVQAVEEAIDELEKAVDDDSAPAGTVLQAVADVASSASTLVATLDDGACG